MCTERNVLITVQYDGTEYHGWQEQPGLRTVQGTLREVVAEALGCPVEVQGASRTDRGVHACGQAASFITSTPVPSERLPRVLNAVLPGDVRVRDAREVPPDFQPRLEAVGKIYRYSFLRRGGENIFLRRFASTPPGELDLQSMRQAAEYLVGEHDFRSFQSASKDAPKTTIRKIYGVCWATEGPLLHFQVAGSGFLYNMVRTMAGTLLEVGLGKRSPSSMVEILAARDRRAAGSTAEAKGLCLVGVFFGLDELEREMRACSIFRPFFPD